MIEKPFSECSY